MKTHPSEQSLPADETGSMIYTVVVSVIAAVGGLLFGFDNGVIAGALPFFTKYFGLNAVQEGFSVSNLVIGAAAGAVFAGFLTDRFGRKRILIATALMYIVSAVFSGLARTFFDLVVARMLGGVAIGISSVASPMYIAELSPARLRGRLVTINQLTIVGGILISYFSNWLLVDIGPDNWRWMFVVMTLPAGIFFIAMFFVPESPRWLVLHGMTDRAMKIFTRVGGRSHAEREISGILMAGEIEKGSLSELFHPGFRRALIIGVLLSFFAHMVGINAVNYYAPRIFLQAGFGSANSALLASLMVMLTLFVFTIVAIFTIDVFGRKPLLIVGSLAMGIAFIFTGAAFQSPHIGGIWLLVAIIAYDGAFAVSMGGVIWVYLSEIFPNKIRGRAMSIATMVLWITEFIVAQTFPWLVDTYQGKTFYMYAAFCFASFFFVWFMIVETKGKSLEEIEYMWKEREAARQHNASHLKA